MNQTKEPTLKEVLKTAHEIVSDTYDSNKATKAFEEIITLTEKLPLQHKTMIDMECLIAELISVMPKQYTDKYINMDAFNEDYDMDPNEE